jgi:N6-adenosine-specific RNA methylase IME4
MMRGIEVGDREAASGTTGQPPRALPVAGLVLPAHPFAELFPLIEGEEFLAFAEDIRANGVRDPIVLLGDSILDGRNRANALAHLAETGEILGEGWGHRAGEPLSPDCLEDDYPWIRKFNRDVDGDPLAWVLSKNLKRRHLDESQRAMVAAKIANLGVGRPAKPFEPAPDHIPSIGGISARAAARLLNVGHASIERARTVLRDGAHDLQHAVEQGRVAVSTAEAIASLPQDEQLAIVAKSEKEILSAAKDIRARQRRARFAEVNDRLAKISAGNRDVDTSQRFPILYLDPASRFKSGFGDRSIENHYPTMEWPEILALPIPELATDIALMLCWTTVPQLANTMRAIEHWGFEYVSEWCWDKVDQGTGYWGFNQHETLLIAKRGKFPAPIPGTQPRSLYSEKKTDHSAKPAWFAEQIERIWPDLPKVELFARNPRPGWKAWGNQSNSEIPREEASGTAREAPSTGCGTPDENQDVRIQSAPPQLSPSALAPAMAADTATSPGLTDRPVEVAVEFPSDPLDLPSFLKRDADNTAPFAKGAAA